MCDFEIRYKREREEDEKFVCNGKINRRVSGEFSSPVSNQLVPNLMPNFGSNLQVVQWIFWKQFLWKSRALNA